LAETTHIARVAMFPNRGF